MPIPLSKDQARRRLAQLRQLIDEQRYQYHVLNRQDISDAALDSLKHELAQLESAYPDLITPDSPSQRVAGQPLPEFKKVPHAIRMISLSDVFSGDELADWDARWRKLRPANRPGYLVDLKLDGLAVSLIYRHGLLRTATTRGDGMVGEDVTQNVRTIEAVPLKLRTEKLPAAAAKMIESGEVIIRGEVVMLKKDFEALNRRQAKTGQPAFANPRNVAAGSIRQLDPKIAASRRLDFYAWELTSDIGQTTLAESYEWLKAMGVKINPRSTTAEDLAAIERFHSRIYSQRDQLPFWIDGVVVKLDDCRLSRALGFVGKTPRAATAWKFSAEQATTVVEDIVVQVGRTGALTPVAHLRPTLVAGTTVARATLHNADEVARLDVRVGDTVIIQKAGDIIPDIVEVLTKLRPRATRPWKMPTDCPVCRRPVRREEGEAITYCPNGKCPARQREHLYHFASRPALDIEGLGPSTVDTLIEEGLVRQASDFFRLRPEQLVGLPLFAAKRAEKLVASIQARRKVPLDRLIMSLGIRHIGAATARDLAVHFGTLLDLRAAKLEELERLPNVGAVVARSVADYFSDPRQQQEITRLDQLIATQRVRPVGGGPLRDKSVVVTGALATMSREEAQEAVRQAGGKAVNSVSAKTAYVVAGTDPGSKYERAKALGVTILTEDKFKKMVGR